MGLHRVGHDWNDLAAEAATEYLKSIIWWFDIRTHCGMVVKINIIIMSISLACPCTFFGKVHLGSTLSNFQVQYHIITYSHHAVH